MLGGAINWLKKTDISTSSLASASIIIWVCSSNMGFSEGGVFVSNFGVQSTQNVSCINYEGAHKVSFFGGDITVRIFIRGSLGTTIDFNCVSTTCNVTFTKWSHGGMSRLFELFHNHEPRDPVTFGSRCVDEDGDGNVHSVNVTIDQKYHIIIQAVRDILLVIDRIAQKYPRSLIDYAMWHLERPQETTYSEYIENLACHLIVNANILGPNAQFDRVHL